MSEKEDAAWAAAQSGPVGQTPPLAMPLTDTPPSPDAIQQVLDNLKTHIPVMRAAYLIWLGYTVESDITSTVIQAKVEAANAYLTKDPKAVTDDDTFRFIGDVLRIAAEAGKDALSKLTPLLGRDAIALAAGLGLL